MRILVATDAWHPQVNGVVRTLTMMAAAATALGADVNFLTPQSFRTVAMPSYPDLRVALPGAAKIARLIAEARPDNIHIATEGPIGLAVRHYCRKHQLPFTTSFHTRFPEYISARLPIPESWSWSALRWFHGAGQAVMAATPALAGELRARGFRNVVLWPRGVDAQLFRPRAVDLDLPRPVFLSVGRVAVEKILKHFSNSICRAPRSWLAMALRGWLCNGNIRKPSFWARFTANPWRKPMPPPTFSCSRARQTRSVWSFWRHWRAACRWRRSR